jgi:hypothetical protein
MKKVHNDLGRAYAHRNYMGLIDITFNNFENGAASRNARAAAGGIWNSEEEFMCVVLDQRRAGCELRSRERGKG